MVMFNEPINRWILGSTILRHPHKINHLEDMEHGDVAGPNITMMGFESWGHNAPPDSGDEVRPIIPVAIEVFRALTTGFEMWGRLKTKKVPHLGGWKCIYQLQYFEFTRVPGFWLNPTFLKNLNFPCFLLLPVNPAICQTSSQPDDLRALPLEGVKVITLSCFDLN